MASEASGLGHPAGGGIRARAGFAAGVDGCAGATALAPNDPEVAHAARHLAYAIGLRARPEAKAHRVLLDGATGHPRS